MKDLSLFNDNKRNPFRMWSDLDRDLSRISGFSPQCDIEDKESHYLVSFDVPGIPKEEINVEVENGMLRVSGERRSEKKEKDYSEKSYGSFQRVMTLPANVNEDEVEANYENGVLNIAIPKSEEQKNSGKKISVSEGKREGVWEKLLPHRKKSSDKTEKKIQ